jgi:hypothetical protein
MITGRWDLKISNYGLKNIRRIQIESTDSPGALITKNDMPCMGGSSAVEYVLRAPETLLWLAPESTVLTWNNMYWTDPGKQSDIYR